MAFATFRRHSDPRSSSTARVSGSGEAVGVGSTCQIWLVSFFLVILPPPDRLTSPFPVLHCNFQEASIADTVAFSCVALCNNAGG